MKGGYYVILPDDHARHRAVRRRRLLETTGEPLRWRRL